jgi:hypothetical protein
MFRQHDGGGRRTVWAAAVGMIAMGFGLASPSVAANPAQDDASQAVYFNFPNPDGLSGLNGGTGFGPWATSKRISSGFNEPGWPGFTGWFQAFGNIGAAGNPDLEDIGTIVSGQPGRPAWGSYANSTDPTRGVAITAATRDFTGGELAQGQTFSVQMEHGNVSFYPNIFDLRTFGWVGVVLHTNASWAPDPFQNGLGFYGTIGFGFRGGQSFYEIVSPAGTELTDIPFTQRGLKIDFTRDNATQITLRVTRLSDNQQWTFVRALGFGELNGFGLVNRYAREANVYFNALSVTGEPPAQTGACCFGSICLVTTAAECASAGRQFRGAGVACNVAGVRETPCCFANFNQDTSVNIDDIFVYLNAWFASEPRTDVGGDGVSTPTIDDIFVYLNAWFAGCATP